MIISICRFSVLRGSNLNTEAEMLKVFDSLKRWLRRHSENRAWNYETLNAIRETTHNVQNHSDSLVKTIDLCYIYFITVYFFLKTHRVTI